MGPTISLNITHVAGMDELAEVLIEHESPAFGVAFGGLLGCLVKHLLAMPTASYADHDAGLKMQGQVMRALSGCGLKIFMAKGVPRRYLDTLRSEAVMAFKCPPKQW